jgi:hypothetical protein
VLPPAEESPSRPEPCGAIAAARCRIGIINSKSRRPFRSKGSRAT